MTGRLCVWLPNGPLQRRRWRSTPERLLSPSPPGFAGGEGRVRGDWFSHVQNPLALFSAKPGEKMEERAGLAERVQERAGLAKRDGEAKPLVLHAPSRGNVRVTACSRAARRGGG